MDYEIILSILGLLGIGGIIGGYFQYLWHQKQNTERRIQELNENKYRSTLIFMRCMLTPENFKQFDINDPNFPYKSSNEIIKKYAIAKVVEYYYNSMLYASDDVIKTEQNFINNPSESSFIEVAFAMRKDLWKKKTNIKELL